MEDIKTHEVIVYKKFSFKTFKKEWRWKVKAENSNIIASSSEGYINKQDCLYNMRSTGKSLLEKYNY